MDHLSAQAGNSATRSFQELLPDGVIGAVWNGDGVPELLPSEAETIRRAIATRREEFARGRACARMALESLGFAPTGIPVGERRAPVWPSGVVGSITHTAGFVGAAVARSSEVAGVGVDVENVRPLERPVRERILTPEELDAVPLPEWDILAFSAKESVHKVVYPLTGIFLDFRDVAIKPDLERRTFRVEARSDRAESVAVLPRLVGRYRILPPLVMTALWTEPIGAV